MKLIYSMFTVILMVIVLSNSNIAQDKNCYSVTTWHIKIPNDKSDAELNNLMKEFSDRIALQNGIVVNEKTLQSDNESDQREYMFIKEYVNSNHAEQNIRKNNRHETNPKTNEKLRQEVDVYQYFYETYSEEAFLELQGNRRQ